MISASVVVCTRNRWPLLEACLASLALQTFAEPEIVVVDNGSTDETKPELEAWRRAGDRRVVVAEPAAGLSRSRNRGLEVAQGDLVLFLDDDALAPVAWVAAHAALYDDERIVGAGGPVVLTFPYGRPRWAGSALEHWWSALSHGEESKPFPGPHGPYGTNMSMRRATAIAAGSFSHRLGRVGRSLVSSEEADLFDRLKTYGVIWYEPAAVVMHQVTPDRLRRRWLLRRGAAQGRTNARREGVLSGRQLYASCAAHLAVAWRRPAPSWRALVTESNDDGSALNEWCVRAGHLAWAGEHLLQRAPGRRTIRPEQSVVAPVESK